MKTTEKPMKHQRRNNEKQWKTKDNFASILSYFFSRYFWPLFFSSFPSSMGKEIRDNFERKDWKPLSYFSVYVVFWVIYGGKHAAQRELNMFSYPKICTLYGNTVVSCSDALKLIMLTGFPSFDF